MKVGRPFIMLSDVALIYGIIAGLEGQRLLIMRKCTKQPFRFVRDCCIGKRYEAFWQITACRAGPEDCQAKCSGSRICLKLADTARAQCIHVNVDESAGPKTVNVRRDKYVLAVALPAPGARMPCKTSWDP